MLEPPESPIVVWSRPPSLRSLRSQRVIAEQYVLNEPDTICILPNSMRMLCIVLTFLLISSLALAIVNSLQGSSKGSISYCKTPEEAFTPKILCARESMFLFYQCCPDPQGNPVCCSRLRVWLILAVGSVLLSCVLGIVYFVFNYCCGCLNTNRSQNNPTRL